MAYWTAAFVKRKPFIPVACAVQTQGVGRRPPPPPSSACLPPTASLGSQSSTACDLSPPHPRQSTRPPKARFCARGTASPLARAPPRPSQRCQSSRSRRGTSRPASNLGPVRRTLAADLSRRANPVSCYKADLGSSEAARSSPAATAPLCRITNPSCLVQNPSSSASNSGKHKQSVKGLPGNRADAPLLNAASVAVSPRQGTSVISPLICFLNRSLSLEFGMMANAVQREGMLKVLLWAWQQSVREAPRNGRVAV